MNCRRVDCLLSDHLEGLLSPRQARAVTAHLAGCPLCHRRREQLGAVGAELRCIEALCRPPDLLDRTLEQWLAVRETALPARQSWFPELKSWQDHRGTGVSWRAAAMAAATLVGAAAITVLLWGPLGARGPSD